MSTDPLLDNLNVIIDRNDAGVFVIVDLVHHEDMCRAEDADGKWNLWAVTQYSVDEVGGTDIVRFKPCVRAAGTEPRTYLRKDAKSACLAMDTGSYDLYLYD